MGADVYPFPGTAAAQAPDPAPAGDKLLIDTAELARLTSLSKRTIRRMDAARDIPGRVTAGRRVLYQSDIIRQWVKAGLPGRAEWEALQRARRPGR